MEVKGENAEMKKQIRNLKKENDGMSGKMENLEENWNERNHKR